MTVAAGRAAAAAPATGSRRDLALLTAGMAVSTAGDSAALVALSVQLRGSGPGWVSALLGAGLLPVVLLAPLAGRLVDRVENRRLLLVCLIGQAVLALPLALAQSVWAIIGLFAALSAFSAVVRPATQSLVPVITGGGDAGSGYARIGIGTGLGFILGPAAGGVLTGAFGARTALLADAVTFAVLALACTALRARRRPQPAADHDSGRGVGGATVIWRDRVLRTGLGVSAITIACMVVDNVAAPFRFIDELSTTAGGYGTYLTLWGVGALIGSQLTPRLARAVGPERALACGNALSGLGILGVGLAPGLAVAYLASVAGGVGNGVASVSQSTLVSSRTDPALHGRAFAAVGALVQTAVGVGTAAGAPLVAVLGAGGAMTAAGGVAAVLAVAHLTVATRRR